jgi:hypothetical protein
MNIARKALFMTGKENFRAVLQAFSFISDSSNWLAITVLAAYISAGRMNSIDGEEVMPYLIPPLARSC